MWWIKLGFALWVATAAAEPGDDLYTAVSRDDLAGVRAALAAGASPMFAYHYTHRPGMVGRFFGQRTETRTDTPFEHALRQVAQGNAKAEPILRALLDAGAPADRGMSELLGASAADASLSPGQVRAITALSEAGVSPERWLCSAARVGDAAVLRWALTAGAPVEADCDGVSPLARSVAGGRSATAQALLDAGASRAALDEDRTLFEIASAALAAELLAHPRPFDDRERVALFVAWSRAALSTEQVGGLIPEAFTVDIGRRMLEADGAAGVLAAAEAVGLEGLVALVDGPVGRLWRGADLDVVCALRFGLSPSAASAVLGEGTRTAEGPLLPVWSYPAGDAYFVRPFPGLPPRLWAATLPDDCDPVAGALVGQPRSVVRLALGAPVRAWPDRDLWRPGTRAHDRGRHEAWLVVRYEEGAALRPVLDWRQP